MSDALRRLRARGSVLIEGDADGWSLSWWPRGQRGNPLVGRGGKGSDLELLAVKIEEATRPAWNTIEGTKWARLRHEEHEREWRERAREREARRVAERIARDATRREEIERRRRQREARKALEPKTL